MGDIQRDACGCQHLTWRDWLGKYVVHESDGELSDANGADFEIGSGDVLSWMEVCHAGDADSEIGSGDVWSDGEPTSSDSEGGFAGGGKEDGESEVGQRGGMPFLSPLVAASTCCSRLVT